MVKFISIVQIYYFYKYLIKNNKLFSQYFLSPSIIFLIQKKGGNLLALQRLIFFP